MGTKPPVITFSDLSQKILPPTIATTLFYLGVQSGPV
jgi:hypothetical protein